MKRIPLILLLLIPFAICADDSPSKVNESVRFQLPNTSLDDVLRFYSHLALRDVHIAAGVGGTVTIMTEALLDRAEAITLIRKTLLEQYGIEIQHVGDSRADVIWTVKPEFASTRQAVDAGGFRVRRLGPDGTPLVDISKERVIQAPKNANR